VRLRTHALVLAGLLVASPAVALTVLTGSVKAPDGVEIRYEAAGNGEPALVFVHCWSCDRSYWSGQAAHFAKSRRIVAIDLAGHGESGRERQRYTVEAFGTDVKAVVDALGLKRVVLVGHSMGGPVILEAARLMPEEVAALVPIDTLGRVGEKTSPEERRAFLDPMRADFAAATRKFVREFMFTPKSDPALADRIAQDMAAAPKDVALSALESLVDYDEAAALAAVKAPLRLINTDRWPTDLAAARKYKPDVQLAVMPGLGHFPMLEDPAEFNRLLERALKDLVAP
jgi:pimeloyl-ACP methyl ester carboxylesterase